jgi:hypothetical protein
MGVPIHRILERAGQQMHILRWKLVGRQIDCVLYLAAYAARSHHRRQDNE